MPFTTNGDWQEFMGAYPGFEGIGAFNDPNRFVIDLVKKKMSSLTAPTLSTFYEEAIAVLDEEFGDSKGMFKATSSFTS